MKFSGSHTTMVIQVSAHQKILMIYLMKTWQMWQTIGPILRRIKISFIQR